MTVQELIDKLQTFDSKAFVVVEDFESECYDNIVNVRQVIPKNRIPIVMIDVSDS